MSKLKNKTIATVLTLTLFSSIAVCPLHATTHDTFEGSEVTMQSSIQPFWNNVRTVSLAFDCENSNIYISLKITGLAGTTFKNGVIKLEKIAGNDTGVKKTWTKLSSSKNIFSFIDESVPAQSGTYRVTYSIDAVRNGVTENINGTRDLKI